MKSRHHTSHATVIGRIFGAALLAGALFTGHSARAGIDVQINIGNAPPPPRLGFETRPHERFYRGEGVYVVDDPGVGDNDMFRYGRYYWVFRDGYWYRSYSWHGPFVVVYPRYVPAVFYRMPPTQWRHRPNGPPRFAPQGAPPSRQPQPAYPPRHVLTGGGNPPGHITQGGPPPHAQPAAPPVHKQPARTPPGQQKKGERGDKGDNGNGKDKGGEHGH